MSTRRITIETDGLTASALVWGLYRSTSVGLVERFLDLNPSIATAETAIPVGTVVTIDVNPGERVKSRSVVKLWS